MPTAAYTTRPSLRTLVVLLLIVLAGAFLRTWRLRREALDGDEVFSRRVALAPVGLGYQMAREDLVQPPLYYLLLKCGIGLWGAGVWGVRALSLAAGIAAIPLTWLIGRRLRLGEAAGLLAAGIVALNSADIFYAQQARSYALYTLLVLLLTLWLGTIAERQSGWLWAAGGLLMGSLVYLHYVGSVYLGCGVGALALSSAAGRVKRWVVAMAGAASVGFLPWLIVEAGVYTSKHGLGENLDWQGHPRFYDLKAAIAMSMGVVGVHGGTTVGFLMVGALLGAALLVSAKRGGLRRNALLLILLEMGLVPPLLLFLLSREPLNLPIFGLRQIVPSTVLLCLVCCYGLEALYRMARPFTRRWLTMVAALMVVIAAAPTVTAAVDGPARVPYDQVAAEVAAQRAQGTPAYTTWPYGIGGPVNFYCRGVCVDALPQDARRLPDRVLVLYRPGSAWEREQYLGLLGQGFVALGGVYYSDGANSSWGTRAETLRRQSGASPAASTR